MFFKTCQNDWSDKMLCNTSLQMLVGKRLKLHYLQFFISYFKILSNRHNIE